MINNDINMYYNKVYCDDLGKRAPDIFSKNVPEYTSYRRMWSGVIDGFMECVNTDLIFFCTEGNIRIVVCDSNDPATFHQYFMGGLDGKTITISRNTKFAIQNIDESKSAFMVGHFQEHPSYNYSSKTQFDWRKKLG